MREERNEELEIRKNAKKKANKMVFITDVVIATIMLLLMIGLATWKL